MGESELPESENVTGRTLKAAYRARLEGGRTIVKPGELIEARYAKGTSPSLMARKVLALLIAKAGSEAWRPGSHTITKKELRGSHNGNDRITGVLNELMDLKFSMRTISGRGREAVLTSALMSWNIEEKSEDGMSIVEWEFSEAARQMLQGSDYFGRINRAALLSFRSKYALAIYELGCLLVGRRDKVWRGTIDELREKLGVPEGKMTNFAFLRRDVLAKSKEEVEQLAHFQVDWKEIRKGGRGGRVDEVELHFTPKEGSAVNEAADEVERPRIGRAARRDGSVEAIVADDRKVVSLESRRTFPKDSLHFCTDTRIVTIVSDFGGGWDRDLIASAYREQMGDRLDKLFGETLYKSFEGFCRSFVKSRGRAR